MPRHTILPIFLATAVAGLAPADAQQPPPRPCAAIRQVCLNAGFVMNGARAGEGLIVDCIRPIMQGTPQPARAYKCWPISHFASLIIMLWQRNIPVLLLSGPANSERMTELLSQLPMPPSSPLLTTLIFAPLCTVAQRLQACLGYIGNDSGITHLAALLATPTIVLFGPSDPAIWQPYGSTTCVLYEPVLTNLRPDTVFYTVEEFFCHAH